MAKQKLKVLFFIASTVATDEENEAMDEFSARHTVCIRNASMIGDNDAIEPFDLVAGCVPPRYAAEAELKGPPVVRETPKTAADSAPKGSPLAPPAAVVVETPAAPAEPVQAGAPAADAAKPKTPAPKPDAAKGWKPQA